MRMKCEQDYNGVYAVVKNSVTENIMGVKGVLKCDKCGAKDHLIDIHTGEHDGSFFIILCDNCLRKAIDAYIAE